VEDFTMLDIITDKQSYEHKDILSVTVRNNGENSLFFPDTVLGLKVVNLLNYNTIYQWTYGPSITELQQNESYRFIWKMDNNIQLGNYGITLASKYHLEILNL
jgi:hypothetical protein